MMVGVMMMIVVGGIMMTEGIINVDDCWGNSN